MTGNARPGTRILGSLGSASGTDVVRVEDRTTPTSTTCGRHSQSPAAWPAGTAR
jgi:hypothetical protein